MANEYRESLQAYDEMQKREVQLTKDWSEGKIIEEELIAFCQDLEKYWPIMHSIEQRTEFMNMRRFVFTIIDSYRSSIGREGKARGRLEYMGIFGQRVSARKSICELSPEVHDGRPLLSFSDVVSMADAVDKRTQNRL